MSELASESRGMAPFCGAKRSSAHRCLDAGTAESHLEILEILEILESHLEILRSHR